MTEPAPNAVAKLTFEDALAELEQIVSELERGETPLEQTIARFERGVALARRCEDRLNEADRTVAMLLAERTRVVEVDLETGERLRSRPDPGEARGSRAPERDSEPGRLDPSEAPPAKASRRDQPPAAAGPRDESTEEPARAQAQSRRPRPPSPPGPQLSLDNPYALKGEREMDDDDIPF